MAIELNFVNNQNLEEVLEFFKNKFEILKNKRVLKRNRPLTFNMLRIVTLQLSRHISARSLANPQQLSQIRNLFTKDFLGVSVFLQKQKIALKEFADKNTDIPSLREDVQRSFGVVDTQIVDENAVVKSEENLQKVMLSDDVRKMIYTSANHQVGFNKTSVLLKIQ